MMYEIKVQLNIGIKIRSGLHGKCYDDIELKNMVNGGSLFSLLNHTASANQTI